MAHRGRLQHRALTTCMLQKLQQTQKQAQLCLCNPKLVMGVLGHGFPSLVIVFRCKHSQKNTWLTTEHHGDPQNLWCQKGWRGMAIKVCGCYSGCFHVLQLLLNRFTQQKLCCISKSLMKHQQMSDGKSNLLWFSYDYRNCIFVDFLIDYMYIGPPNYVHYRVWSR